MLGLAVAVAVAVWLITTRSGDGLVRYRAATVDRGVVQESVTATGTVFAVETVAVGSVVSGRVVELLADDNDEVVAGEVIARLDPAPFAAQVAQAEAQLRGAQASQAQARLETARATRERDRLAPLLAARAIARAEVEAATSAVDLAKAGERAAAAELGRARAALDEARLNLAHATIVSPIAGIVLAREVEVGQTVAAALQAPTLFTIARDLQEMEVRASIDEADVGKVREGLTARFTVDAYRDQAGQARVERIRRSPTVTQGVVTYEAVLRFANPDKRYWPGMTATVSIVTERKEDALRVPNEALRFKPPLGAREARAEAASERAVAGAARGRRRVFVVEPDGTLRKVEVQVGAADEQHAEVVAGDLDAGDRVAIAVDRPGRADHETAEERSGGAPGPAL